MNKKFLSVVLFGALMAGSSVTFTGCIDNDEPQGIIDLRGAKAELIKAKAAVELANEAMVRANVANQELLNKAQELANKRYEIETELSNLEVELKRLEVEKAQATTAEHKAKAEAAIAEANRHKAYWENQKALDAEEFKKNMLNAQAETAKAQEAYDNVIKLIEAGKLLMSDAEKAIIGKAQNFLTAAAISLKTTYGNLVEAQKAYNAALIDGNVESLASLEAQLEKLKIQANTTQLTIDEYNRMLALAEDFDAVAWDEEVTKLKAKIQNAEVSRDSAEVEVVAIKVGEKYQAADDAYIKAVETLGKQTLKKEGAYDKETNKYVETAFTDKTDFSAGDKIGTTNNPTVIASYLKAQEDSIKRIGLESDYTDPVYKVSYRKDNYAGEELKIAKFESKAIDEGLLAMFTQSGLFTDINAEGKFAYNAATYKQWELNKDSAELAKDPEYTNFSADASERLRTVEGWLESLNKFSSDANGEAWAEIEKTKEEKRLKDATKAYGEDKANWEIALAAYKGTATAVPTTEFKKAKDAYNTAFNAVKSAVEAYNKAYDDVYTAAYNKHIADTKNEGVSTTYREKLVDAAKAKDTSLDDAKIANMTNAQLEAIVNDAKAVAELKVDAEKVIDKLYESNKNAAGEETNKVLIALQTAAKTKAEEALTADKDEKVANAKTALENAQKAELSAQTAFGNAQKAYAALAGLPYGQIKDYKDADATSEKIYGTGDLVVADKNNKDKKAMGEKRTAISDGMFTTLSKVKLDETTAETALATCSKKAFGEYLAWDAAKGQYRAVEATRADVEKVLADKKITGSATEIAEALKNNTNFGSFGATIASENLIEYWGQVSKASEKVAPVKAEIEAAYAALKAEIAANDALATPFVLAAQEAKTAISVAEKAVAEAESERDAISAEAEAVVEKYTTYVEALESILNNLESQIAGMKPDGTPETADTAAKFINWLKEEIALQKETLANKNTLITAKEKEIEMFKNGDYTQAYVIEMRKLALETATKEYEGAKAVYDSALADLNKVLETLTK